MHRELHFPTPIYIADIKHPTLNQELERIRQEQERIRQEQEAKAKQDAERRTKEQEEERRIVGETIKCSFIL